MPERVTFTPREAVLASLLLHACLIIFVLLFPGVFSPSGASLRLLPDPNEPIALEFLDRQRQPPEIASRALGDAGRQRRSEPRPDSAPPPQNDDPYAVGNNLNRFVAPPFPERAAPSPRPSTPQGSPGQPGADSMESGEEAAPGEREEAGGDGESGFLVPREGAQGAGVNRRRPGGLRQALGKMSLGMSGGPPLKYDNPVGGLSGPLGGLSFDTPGFDWGPYARKIYWVIWANWTQGWPPAARAGLQGVVTVRFRIHRDGTVTGITVEDPSGTPAFDTCATLALEASNPLPALPEEFPKESEGITARFFYNMEAQRLSK